MRTSRRYQIRLPAPLASELESFGGQHGLAISSTIRLLIGRGLGAEANGRTASGQALDSAASLAALAAAEHAVLMVASVLPEGQRRMRELASEAVLASEARLALFKESGL